MFYQSMLDYTQIHVQELPSPSSSGSLASMASMVAGRRDGECVTPEQAMQQQKRTGSSCAQATAGVGTTLRDACTPTRLWTTDSDNTLNHSHILQEASPAFHACCALDTLEASQKLILTPVYQ